MQYPFLNFVSQTILGAVAGPLFTYGYDTMGRPNTLTQNNTSTSSVTTVVSGVQYGPANEMTALTYFGTLEAAATTASYN